MQTGLVQSREEFILPDDAYPKLQNAYVWRERILRKQGYQLLGRLQRNIPEAPFVDTTGNTFTINILTTLFPGEPTASLVPGTVIYTILAGTTRIFTDNGLGQLISNVSPGSNFGTVNYATGLLSITSNAGFPRNTLLAFSYYPGLPVMGIRIRELQNSANDQTIFFDQVYAYIFNSGTNQFQEFIPGTTWNASGQPVSGTDFFWSTNYWVSDTVIPGTVTPFFTTTNRKLFWETNNTGQFGATADPIRITDGVTWVDFDPPNFGQIDVTNFMVQCLSFLPYRGRLVAFNTWEGPSFASAQNFSNRIRWSTIGNPFIPFSAGPPAKGSWRDDIRGQGGFLDIPTSEDIISIGFVRDNLVIYCERSTWQLRYTGRSIAPFQVERVNSELGGEGPFSAVQFDTSLVGIGDKGIVECDSYKSERIDIKIPDFVFSFRSSNNGPFRVHGIRDFIKRLAFWTIPLQSYYDPRVDPASWIFPNQRLVYNYENDSWALYTDSLTTLGNYQPQTSRTWLNTAVPWIRCNFSWLGTQIAAIPSIVGGNQQGFVEYLDQLTTNDPSLFISNIMGHGIAGTPLTGTATVVTSPNHNLKTSSNFDYSVDFIIGISGIIDGSPYSNLNGGIFGIIILDADSFELTLYDPESRQFSTPQLDVPTGTYIGGGVINIRDNFSIVSKKFNFLDQGQNIQLGYLDILMSATEPNQPGAISLNVFLDYNQDEASNTLPQNQIHDYSIVANPDTFFNSIIPTSTSSLNTKGGTKFWQRVYCATRASFLTLEYTFSNGQLSGEEQTKDVQIDAQILWLRRGGRMTSI